MTISKSLRIGKRSKRGSRGQALIETALVTIALLLLLSVLVDGGRAYFTYIALQNSVGEGALYGSIFPWARHSGFRADPDNILYRTKYESTSRWLDPTKMTVTVGFPSGGMVLGRPVVVTARYPFDLIGPLPGMLGFPTQITLVAQARQTIVAPTNPGTPGP